VKYKLDQLDKPIKIIFIWPSSLIKSSFLFSHDLFVLLSNFEFQVIFVVAALVEYI
jgi:hypothetical protein